MTSHLIHIVSKHSVASPERLPHGACGEVPDANSMIQAAAGQKGALVVPSHAPHSPRMPLERGHTLLVGKAPQLHIGVPRSSSKVGTLLRQAQVSWKKRLRRQLSQHACLAIFICAGCAKGSLHKYSCGILSSHPLRTEKKLGCTIMHSLHAAFDSARCRGSLTAVGAGLTCQQADLAALLNTMQAMTRQTSGWKAAPATQSVWPWPIMMRSQLGRCHTRQDLSSPAVT